MAQKRCTGGRPSPVYIVSAFKVFLKRMKKKRPLKKIKKLKTTTKYQTKFLIFRNCPKKGAQGEAVFILSALKSVFGEERPLKVHPPNVGRGTLILFNSIDCGRLSFPLTRFFLCGKEANDYSFLTSYWLLL